MKLQPKTRYSLRQAVTHEAETAVRMLYFARRADVEGRADVAATLRAIADGEMAQAFGHMEFLEEAEDNFSGAGDTTGNLGVLIKSEQEAAEKLYRELVAIAESDNHEDVAGWFESLIEAESSHVKQLRKFEAQPAVFVARDEK